MLFICPNRAVKAEAFGACGSLDSLRFGQIQVEQADEELPLRSMRTFFQSFAPWSAKLPLTSSLLQNKIP